MKSIKKGNKKVWQVDIQDENGDLVTNLATATEIFYMIKVNKTDDDINAVVSKTLTGGAIVVDTPATGQIQITVDAADTSSIDLGGKDFVQYYQAIEIQYPSDNIKEINLNENDTVKILQDIIRG